MKQGPRTRSVLIALWGLSLLGGVVTAMGAFASYAPSIRLQSAVGIHCIGFASILTGVAFLRRTRSRWKWLHVAFLALAVIGLAYNALHRTPWHVGGLLAVAFVALAWASRRLWWGNPRRIPPNPCQECGYNLTGNVSGVCPECGQEFA